MGLFDSSSKSFLNQFKTGSWHSEAERKEAIAAIRTGGRIPIKGMLQIIQSMHPSESSKERVRTRMSCLEELMEGISEAPLVYPILDLLGVVDAFSREFLVRILITSYQKDFSSHYVEYLKKDDVVVREAIREILIKVGGKTVFELLKEKILSDGFNTYIEAADILCEIAGHHAITLLKAIASGKNREDRIHALEHLANPRYMKLRTRKALDAAYEFLKDSDPVIRLKVINIIGQYGKKEDSPLLVELLGSEERRNLQAVVEALGKVGTPDSIPVLVPILEQAHSSVKIAIIETLGEIDDEQSIEPLVECLRDKNLLVRQKTIEILGKLGSSENIRMGRLLVSMMKDRDVNVRRSIVEVIRLIGHKEEVWWKLIRYLRDEDWWVRDRITEVLAELGGEKIIDPIVSLLDDPSDVVRRYAIEVLARIGDKRAVEPLIGRLSDTDWWVRERAVEALGEFGDPKAVPYLNKMLPTADDILWSVLTALQKFGHKSSYIPLLQILDHELPDIRIEIIKALDSLKEERFRDTLRALINDEDKRVRDFVTSLLPKYKLSPTGVQRKTYEQMTLALLDQMLLDTKAKGGEDLFILAGNRPAMKVRGDVEALDDHVFTPQETETLLHDILTPLQREQFAGMKDIDMSYSIKDEGSRFRVNMYRTRAGMCAVFRVINQEVITIEKLGLPKPVIDFTQLRQGLVLVTGPTGSGKSTTLAAMIDYMNRTRHDHIVTIEDPIEYVHSNKKCIINQREVGAHTRSFSNALRSALREDPDIILVGEMRDLETISIAITAAETGHLVLGTLHTVSAAKTIDRIIDVFPGRSQAQIRAMLSESLRGVLSQQLLKRKGQSGRIMSMELMMCNDAVSNLIRKEKIFQIPSILTTSFEQGMLLMDNELMRLVKEDKIYPEDAYIKAINKKEFEIFLEKEGIQN